MPCRCRLPNRRRAVRGGPQPRGAYGVVAALSLLADEQLLHTAATERRLLAASIEAGCVDGVRRTAAPSVDGIPSGVHEGGVGVLVESATAALDDSS
mgnify:CR=1 FL=1